MSIIDVSDHAIVTYHIGLTCEAKHLVQITHKALMKRQLFDQADQADKPVIRSDNGPQFISNRFAEACTEFGMVHEPRAYST
ncbi:transposase [Paenibacillus algicola]|uniref:Transposase n=1 Tax=Paenibacillus algicola TaxID=2565926 RepID=A0A4P8XNF0_9BACL|nr:transposase family protein [Paenibacillus algicola]QCT04382.1 transposase [Paenibacillus algicola]